MGELLKVTATATIPIHRKGKCMSVYSIQLRKFLKLCQLEEKQLVSELRADIRQTISKEQGYSSGGGDFHVPFWADAKAFIASEEDLSELTKRRIEKNPSRKRLYPLMKQGFLDWWYEKRRWSNEQFEIIPFSVKGRIHFGDLDAVIKVENLMAVQIGEELKPNKRLIYPYFAESPVLDQEAAQLGLWIMSKTLEDFDIQDMRILDVLRGRSFSFQESSSDGNEEELLNSKYKYILDRWNSLRKEYPKSAA